MAERIYTRTGDGGETGLFGGARVPKDAARVEACGAIDELNCVLGEAACRVDDPDLAGLIARLQHMLFALGADVAAPAASARVPRVGPADVEHLETAIDRLEAGLPPLRQFILPGGTAAAAALHTARAACRRAERRCVTLASLEAFSPHVLALMNRLSDLLFVMARAANARAGAGDIPWEGGP